MVYFGLAVAAVVFIVWLEELNYRVVHTKVSDRWRRGDKSCGAKKEWWGWRVQEYPDCDL